MKTEPLKLPILALLLFLALSAPAAVVSVGPLGANANLLVGSSPGYALGPLVLGGTGATAGDWDGKIVLLDRGGNSFAEKAAAARAAGAVGAIIADNVAEPNFAGQLLPAGTTSPIPVLLVSQADGAALKAHAGELAALGPTSFSLGKIAAPAAPPSTVVLVNQVAGSVKAGASLTFVAIPDGTPPLAFQWSKDGSPIPGATAATLSIAAAAAADAGAYACTESNASGSSTSGPYVLSVSP